MAPSTDDLGLSIDMLDADQLRRWAEHAHDDGHDAVADRMAGIADGVEQAVKDIGTLRDANGTLRNANADLHTVLKTLPELISALKDMVSIYDGLRDVVTSESILAKLAAADAVIAKATPKAWTAADVEEAVK